MRGKRKLLKLQVNKVQKSILLFDVQFNKYRTPWDIERECGIEHHTLSEGFLHEEKKFYKFYRWGPLQKLVIKAR